MLKIFEFRLVSSENKSGEGWEEEEEEVTSTS
jgi:hypothetical protein